MCWVAEPLHLILPGATLPEGGAQEVGNKAWNLMRMAAAGLSVPPGFVLPTSWCRAHRDERAGHGHDGGEARGGTFGADGGRGYGALRQALTTGIARLEAATALGFGSGRRPLLVSVRSGAAVSMPGMLETVLDVGLTAHSVEGLIRLTGNPRLAWDCYRRFVQSFAEVVALLPTEPFDAILREAVEAEQADTERELDFRAMRTVTRTMLDRFEALSGAPFPDDPTAQLLAATAAVFRSWEAPKSVSYRALNGIRDDFGTAVTVQTMVFGNAGGASGSGVGFTRDPATGERALYFDFCFNGQGEDVVAGRRRLADDDRLLRVLPAIHAELLQVRARLETLFGDAQDFEFTVQDGALYLLQTRTAKRTPLAALRIAVEMVEEGLITQAEALLRLREVDLATVGRTRFALPLPAPLAVATVAGPGVASGPVALDAPAAERFAKAGTPPILVRRETATSDIAGIAQAAGILTATGSRTSHAAVVARQLAKVCLIGCEALAIDLDRRTCRIGERALAEGDPISLDGNAGAVYPGVLTVLTERPERELAAIASWRRDARIPA